MQWSRERIPREKQAEPENIQVKVLLSIELSPWLTGADVFQWDCLF